MEFVVPKFINREPKIMGPLTFKQFIFLAIPGFICFILYFVLKDNYSLFVLLAIALMTGGAAFGFVKVKGYPLPIFIKNFFIFLLSTRKFIWHRKIISPKFQKVEKMEQKTGAQQHLKVGGRSHLQTISTKITTRKQ